MKKLLAVSSTILMAVTGTLALTASSFVTRTSSRTPNDEINSFNKVISSQMNYSQESAKDGEIEQILFVNNKEMILEKLEMSKELDGLFCNFVQNEQESVSEIVDNDYIIEYAKNESRKILDHFKGENINFSALINYLQTTVTEFGRTYNLYINGIKGVNALPNHKLNKIAFEPTLGGGIGGGHISPPYTPTDSLEGIHKLVKELKIVKTALVTASAAAAIAAAGFYAAAVVSFGISVNWAIGCTAISAATAAAVEGFLALALVKYDESMSNIKKGASAIAATLSIGRVLGSTTKTIPMTASLSLTPISWEFPPFLALIGTIAAVIELIDVVVRG
ncbi:hypothetical protein EELLY_v1c02340 [Entomoplasma ellychniae]|uniref:Uncharacterized protein n=1 Tax=Entomoplasma ellychniae TaxID=2114 RepID=A0A8E2QYE2_9MOLU|nr:hypothetical protein [Entomoplasma ellychniae]PPE04554.1 hypothetical protein EELLY_v1c02340 [Entomoplasma ellychniae]